MTKPLLSSIAALLATTAGTFAAAFTSGNLVIYRVGDGSAALTNAATAVFLDEYTVAGTPVQSIPLPTTLSGGNFRLTDSGTGISSGQLNLSPDGQRLSFAGYDAALGTASVVGSSVLRTIGFVNPAGAVDTTTTTTAFATDNIRAAVITGNTVLAVGGITGVVALPVGGSGTGTTVTALPDSSRDIAIFGGQLYISSGSGTNTFKGINKVGTGVPTTAGQTTTRLPGLTDTTNPDNYAFAFADLSAVVLGLDTLYVADDGTGGLSKFSLVSGSWSFNGVIGNNLDDYRGLTLSVVGTAVTLFSTRKAGTVSSAAGGGELVSLVDGSGYNGAFFGTPTVLATAANQTAFRGVAFAPVPEPSVALSVLGGAGLLLVLRRRALR